jgi:HD-GYP domain-containing protein (c-di-GMP phosphodiesterase class II)
LRRSPWCLVETHEPRDKRLTTDHPEGPMELCPLANVQDRIKIGSPLPFSIHDQGSKLLLAKNQIVSDERQLEALMDSGAFVNVDELRGARAEIYEAAPELLPSLWRKLGDQLSRVLLGMPSADAPEALDDAARYLAALTERAPDLAIFLLVRPDHSEHTRYGVVRSLHAAAAAYLIALRLAWTPERCLTLVKAAFTMNLGMLDVQERLSNQARLPNPAQRQAIQTHPITSLASLRDSGVTDPEWLQTVAQHHEKPGGGGYPAGVAQVGEMANALRTVDVYTAKLAGRSGRDCLPPGRAARDLLVDERGNPFALALVTEFGIHPPGSLVRLHGGEVAVVVQRTADSTSPQVAVLTGRRGELLAEPVQREAAGREYGIAGSADPKGLKVRISPERLYAKAVPGAPARAG